MRYVFCRRLLQRYRAILHLVDPIIESGHDLSILIHDKNYIVPKIGFRKPWNANISSPNALKYIANNFSIQMNHFDKIHFSTNKHYKGDIFITLDGVVHDKKHVSIPFSSYSCKNAKGKTFNVGSPMFDLIKNAQSRIKPEKNSVLVLHPGGGRGYVSPARKQYSPDKVKNQNRVFLTNLFKMLPKSIQKVTIKTHPVPYIMCDHKSLAEFTPLARKYGFIYSAKSDNLPDLIASHEYVINYGSSTVLWLLGSDIKWFNIVESHNFSKDYTHHREYRERAEKWKEWSNVIMIDNLSNAIANYDSRIQSESNKVKDIKNFYRYLFEINSVESIMKIIGE